MFTRNVASIWYDMTINVPVHLLGMRTNHLNLTSLSLLFMLSPLTCWAGLRKTWGSTILGKKPKQEIRLRSPDSFSLGSARGVSTRLASGVMCENGTPQNARIPLLQWYVFPREVCALKHISLVISVPQTDITRVRSFPLQKHQWYVFPSSKLTSAWY